MSLNIVGSKSDVDFKNVWIGVRLYLPFRFRLGAKSSYSFEWQGREYIIWVINKLDIPNEMTAPETAEFLGANRHKSSVLFSQIIIFGKFELSVKNAKIVEERAGSVEQGDRTAYGLLAERRHELRSATNAFIVAYSRIIRSPWGGVPLETVSVYNLHQFAPGMPVLIACPYGHRLSFEEVSAAINKILIGVAHSPPDGLTGYLHDVDLVAFAKMLPAAIREQQRYSFFDAVFDGVSYSISSEYDKSLLMWAIALEGAVGALLRSQLTPKLKKLGYTDSKAEESIEALQRQHGVSALLPILFVTLVGQEHEVNRSEIDACLKAISLRNRYIHSATPVGKTPKIRNVTIKEFTDGIKAINTIYQSIITSLDISTENVV